MDLHIISYPFRIISKKQNRSIAHTNGICVFASKVYTCFCICVCSTGISMCIVFLGRSCSLVCLCPHSHTHTFHFTFFFWSHFACYSFFVVVRLLLNCLRGCPGLAPLSSRRYVNKKAVDVIPKSLYKFRFFFQKRKGGQEANREKKTGKFANGMRCGGGGDGTKTIFIQIGSGGRLERRVKKKKYHQK